MNIQIPSEKEFMSGINAFTQHEKRDAMYKVAAFLVKHYWGKPRDMADGLGVLLLTWNQAFYRYGAFDFDKLEKFTSDNMEVLQTLRKRDILELEQSDEIMISKLFRELHVALQKDIMRFSEEKGTKDGRKSTRDKLEAFLCKVGVKYNGTGGLRVLFSSVKNSRKLKGSVEFIDKKTSDSSKDYIQLRISALADKDQSILESMKLIRRSPVAVAKALHLLAPKFFPLWDQRIAGKYRCSYTTKPDEKYLAFCWIIRSIADHVRHYSIVRSIKDKAMTKLIDEYNYSKYTKGWI